MKVTGSRGTGEALAVGLRRIRGGAAELARTIGRDRRHEQRQALLVDATQVLDASLDLTTTLQNVAQLAIPVLGELCVIDLVQPDGSITKVATAASDNTVAEALEDVRARSPVDPEGNHPVARVVRSGHSELLPELTDEMLEHEIAQSAEHLQFVRRVRYTSALVVPLRARGRILGACTVLHLRGEAQHDSEDLEVLEQLGRRAAVALDNARLHEEVRATERAQRFLAEATGYLAESLEYQQTLERVASLAVPDLADWCAVDLIEHGELRRLAIAHVDPSKRELGWELYRRYPPSPDAPHGPYQVIRTGEPELISELPDGFIDTVAQDAEHLEILKGLGICSAMVVPLGAGKKTLGAITFVIADSDRRFGSRDLDLALELGRRAATSVENARLTTERTRIAHTLQQSLLPSRLPKIPGCELIAAHRASGEMNEVGGDFYDAFEVGDRWSVVIGDVCGKGAEAAAMTGLARHTIRAAALDGRAPVEVLEILNEAILREGSDEQFCTVCYMTVEVNDDSLELRISRAGHPAPMALRSDGTVELLDSNPGMLLGVFDSPSLTEVGASVEPGEALIIYTDGMTDVSRGEKTLGEAGLAEILAACSGDSAAAICACLGRGVLKAGVEPRDDIALVVLRATEGLQGGFSGFADLTADAPVDDRAPASG